MSVGAHYTPRGLIDPAAGTAGALEALAEAEARCTNPCDCRTGVTLWGTKYGTPACSCTLRKFVAVYGHFPTHQAWTDTPAGCAP